MSSFLSRFALIMGLLVVVAACSGTAVATEHSLVSATEANELVQDPPAGVVILDIRTPEEYAEGHLEDSIMIDFYAADFQDRLDELDKTVPYLVYCRSGNRSATAVGMMEDLEFLEIYEMDGGIVAWAEAGLPYVSS
ncbi:MAG: rhodanese-like domain-containing protein [Actinomycetota bacterium]|nr:rhodanese-like domain-containing protein [Actinomycetota bacterium]